MNSTILYYIHGFKEVPEIEKSRKFLNLESFFKDQYDYGYMSWHQDADLHQLMRAAISQISKYENAIVVGDSTGANFAYQIREELKVTSNIKLKLILTSPLLDVSKRLRDVPFNTNLTKSLVKIENPKDCLIIASKQDDVVEQNWLFAKTLENVQLIEVNDDHRLHYFENCLPAIGTYCS
jgi:predicted esterase YcpF (UPF0227 family)